VAGHAARRMTLYWLWCINCGADTPEQCACWPDVAVEAEAWLTTQEADR
jgi:hypothetical protein